jgi:hypothetical protein
MKDPKNTMFKAMKPMLPQPYQATLSQNNKSDKITAKRINTKSSLNLLILRPSLALSGEDVNNPAYTQATSSLGSKTAAFGS